MITGPVVYNRVLIYIEQLGKDNINKGELLKGTGEGVETVFV